ncbi:L-aspartate oxidase [Gordonia effusa NBRC 100432]|uniref:L-aspartate oxidase n=1 Tax=Gordonia effusa NBRC 100432 TaxID=1077974 RepID=H0R3D3_9ACTN|nr:L-aspartate oxidase [Gordonia effusa]GAB19584.1 L-aspartate oxidase [Gordonia effusa NBRC 100432]
MHDREDADLVVVGAGIAGLTAALSAAAEGLRVVVLNKGPKWRADRDEQSTSTFYAQGGIAVVEPDNPEDSIDLHVSDTIAAGAGLTDAHATRPIIADGWSAITQLVARGADFDRDVDGSFRRTREGGHSVRRIIHAGGDATGAQVQRALGQAVTNTSNPRLTCVDDAVVTDLLIDDGAVVGAAYRTPDSPDVRAVYAPTVLLATGGAGHLYAATTNPAGATADGIALALRAGAQVADLEFIQFHPTMLYLPGARGRRTLISEAVRGEGGRLVDKRGESVTAGVHPMGDLAPRDVVSRAVQATLARTGDDCVYLDISDVDDFERRFPTVTAGLRAAGLADGTVPQRIPVVPGAHYLCGGVLASASGQTSMTGLYVAGEVARTGLHGANRLASNSLLEGLVMGRKAAAAAIERRGRSVNDVAPPHIVPRPAMDRKALQDLMSGRVALARSADGLAEAAAALDAAPSRAMISVGDLEDAALTLTARAVVAAALARTESRGCHSRVDFPDTDSVPSSRVFSFDGLAVRSVVDPVCV